jgi:hypothetical protein
MQWGSVAFREIAQRLQVDSVAGFVGSVGFAPDKIVKGLAGLAMHCQPVTAFGGVNWVESLGIQRLF